MTCQSAKGPCTAYRYMTTPRGLCQYHHLGFWKDLVPLNCLKLQVSRFCFDGVCGHTALVAKYALTYVCNLDPKLVQITNINTYNIQTYLSKCITNWDEAPSITKFHFPPYFHSKSAVATLQSSSRGFDLNDASLCCLRSSSTGRVS